MIARALLGPICATLAVSPCAAQTPPPRPSASAILKQACSNVPGGSELSRERLAEAIVMQNGLLPSDLAMVSGNDLREKLHTSRPQRDPVRFQDNAFLDSAVSRVRQSISEVEGGLERGTAEAALGAVPTMNEGWLFAAPTSAPSIKCAQVAARGVTAGGGGQPPARLIAVREKPEDFAIEGDERKKAASFALGLSKTWKTKDDGSEVEDTTLKVNGAVGLRLPLESQDLSTFVFAEYNLSRMRSDPAPPLPPGARRDEKDTNVLSLGLIGDYYLKFSGLDGSVWVTTQGAYVTNFVDESERIRGSLRAAFPFNAHLGLCGLGSAHFFGGGARFGARCLVQADSEIGFWTGAGLSTTNSYDDFLALGGVGTYELFYNTGDKSQLAGTVSYRYLPVITGELEDVERLEATVKQRFWTEGGLGIDIGVDFKDGTNPLSLEDEKSLSLSFGIIH